MSSPRLRDTNWIKIPQHKDTLLNMIPQSYGYKLLQLVDDGSNIVMFKTYTPYVKQAGKVLERIETINRQETSNMQNLLNTGDVVVVDVVEDIDSYCGGHTERYVYVTDENLIDEYRIAQLYDNNKIPLNVNDKEWIRNIIDIIDTQF